MEVTSFKAIKAKFTVSKSKQSFHLIKLRGWMLLNTWKTFIHRIILYATSFHSELGMGQGKFVARGGKVVLLPKSVEDESKTQKRFCSGKKDESRRGKSALSTTWYVCVCNDLVFLESFSGIPALASRKSN